METEMTHQFTVRSDQFFWFASSYFSLIQVFPIEIHNILGISNQYNQFISESGFELSIPVNYTKFYDSGKNYAIHSYLIFGIFDYSFICFHKCIYCLQMSSKVIIKLFFWINWIESLYLVPVLSLIVRADYYMIQDSGNCHYKYENLLN